MVNATAGSAGQVVLTQTVPRGRLVEAHAKNALATSAAEVAGPGAAGMLIKLAGAPLALLLNAGLLLTSALILRGVAVKETPSSMHQSFWASMLEGFSFVRQHKLLIAMAWCIATWNLCTEAAIVVQILFATQNLHMSARGIGLSYVALGMGTIGASAIAHRLARRIGPGPLMTFGFALGGAGWLLLAAAPLNGYGIGAFVAMLLAYGAGASFIFINHLALRQSVTPPSMLGRMTSTMRWLVMLPAPAGALLGGWLGQHFGLRASLTFSGITALMLALCARQVRVIRDVRTLPTFTSEAVGPFSSEEAGQSRR
jgi:predicted MFS family arabinose efflux permease